jgi:hypothetical protein
MRLQSLGLATSVITVVTLLACKETTSSSFDSDGQTAAPSALSFAKLPPGCRHVHGSVELTQIPSPNDPLGRSIGPSSGSLRGAASSVITTVGPGPTPGTLGATSTDVLVAGPTDILTSNATTTYTPAADPNTFSVETTQTISGGTGKYDGATGTLVVTGTAYDLFGPNAGPGKTHFDLNYDGTVCT